MNNLYFNKNIQLIHKEIQGKLNKTNKIIDAHLNSDIPIIPKLGNIFLKKGKQLTSNVSYQVK